MYVSTTWGQHSVGLHAHGVSPERDWVDPHAILPVTLLHIQRQHRASNQESDEAVRLHTKSPSTCS